MGQYRDTLNSLGDTPEIIHRNIEVNEQADGLAMRISAFDRPLMRIVVL